MSDYRDLYVNVIDKNLCTGCGTCIGICPKEVFSWDEGVKTVRPEACIRCGLCEAACPGHKFDFASDWDSKNEKLIESEAIGRYSSMYVAKAADPEICKAGASGGVITQIACELLEKGVVQGVVGIKGDDIAPYQFKSSIATSREELLSAAGSKYCLIPHNQIIREIKQFSGKVLYIGLPCQVEGLRKAMKADKVLADRIYAVIGLFCGFNMRADATKYLIRKSKIKKEDISEFYYRAKKDGKTGAYIKGKSEKEFFVGKHAYTFMNLFFVPKRCTLCYDYAAEFADLSVGDAWEEPNASRVIVRTAVGKDILWSLETEKKVFLTPCEEKAILTTQKSVVRYKKWGIVPRMRLSGACPDYNVKLNSSNSKLMFKQIILAIIIKCCSSKLGRGLLNIIPFSVLTNMSEHLKGKEIREKTN